MEDLPDAAAFATKLKNTLIQYHSIEDDMWRVAKKTVSQFNYLYLGYIFCLMNQLMTFRIVWKNMDHTSHGYEEQIILLMKYVFQHVIKEETQ